MGWAPSALVEVTRGPIPVPFSPQVLSPVRSGQEEEEVRRHLSRGDESTHSFIRVAIRFHFKTTLF